MGNPTFGTTYFVSGEENGVYVRGNRRRYSSNTPFGNGQLNYLRRKIPQEEYEHFMAPHKFWNLEQTAGGPELMVSPMPSQREPYIVPVEIGTDRPLRQHGKRFLPANVNLVPHDNIQMNLPTNRKFSSGSSTIGSVSESSSYMLQTPFAVNSGPNSNPYIPVFRPTKQRAHSAPPRAGSAVASLLQQNAGNGAGYMSHTSSSRHKRSGNSDAASVSSAATTKSNMSSSRNTAGNTASRVSMSLADFISPMPSPAISGGTPFDAHISEKKTLNNLRRPIGERHTGAVAESLYGYR
jgi:hypothetical protein